MHPRPPISTRPAIRFPYPTLFRSLSSRSSITPPSTLVSYGSMNLFAGPAGSAPGHGLRLWPCLAFEDARAGRFEHDAPVPTCEDFHDRQPLPPLSWPCERRRSEEHTSELQSLMRTSSAVLCLQKKNQPTSNTTHTT